MRSTQSSGDQRHIAGRNTYTRSSSVSEAKYVFIDYENIQPDNLDTLQGQDCLIKVFLSGNRARLPLEMVRALQVFGPAVEYVQMLGTGPNALDFHIAYYLGRLSIAHPKARFFVVSKDAGFDPLIQHINLHGVRCRRVTSMAQICQAEEENASSNGIGQTLALGALIHLGGKKIMDAMYSAELAVWSNASELATWSATLL